MKFDMHCHTKEGSLDGRVGLEDYIRILKDKGFQGMLVTDHNSYDGYRAWKNQVKSGWIFSYLLQLQLVTKNQFHQEMLFVLDP